MLESYLSTAGVVLPFLLKGFWETLKISFFAIIAGSLLGFVIGVVRSYRIRGLHQLLGLYIHVLRGTPFLVQLYIFYFVLPSSGIAWLHWDSATAAFVSLSVYTSCYVAEIIRGAIEAVPRGQTEGAMTLGLKPLQILRLVILPQALRLIVQPMSGVYVMLIKSTAILSVVGITELTRQGEVFIITFPAKSLFIYAMIAAIYFLYCYPLLRLANWLESGWPAACKAPASTRTDAAQHHAHRVRRHLLQAHAVRPATRYPALAGPESTEVCVVGGGLAGLSVALELARRGRQVTLLEGSRIAWAPRAATAARSRPRSRPAPTPSAAMWTRSITARFTGCRWRAWRSSAPTSATWTSATPTRSTAACAWCATTPATRCSAGAMNSSGSSSATCACCRAPSCASGW